ncbi:MAG: hypothetical protein JSS49_15390 [Planctomycetes bacterium]|nr:hypothetical protein [Planctomycetota bacterium]
MQGCNWQRTLPKMMIAFAIAMAVTVRTSAQDVSATWQDDASLRDVQFVGSKAGIAVGDQGAVWKTADGGRTWNLLPGGASGSLNSCCFITSQICFVAGSEISPFTGLDSGVLMLTEDGGQTWRKLGNGTLNPITYVKFFGPEEGIIVGRPSTNVPTGIQRTADGGKTWHPIAGAATAPWRAASFIAPDMGAVGGPEGRLSLVGGDQLLASKLPLQGLRSVRAVTLANDDSGWMAGDGGLVLRTSSGGVVWESPAAPLPEELRLGMDFRAVEIRGENVWLAGSPGSVIWHSPNAGRTWQRYLTGQTAPLNSLRFVNESTGIAVGEFGTILRTEDGGRTWQPARAMNRRAAILSLQARPSLVTAAWLAKLSGEQGYRSAVWIANRQDLGPAATEDDVESRLKAAVEQCGGNSAEIFWQLPITVPGLEFSSDKLIADWQRRTEGKLAPSLLSVLVRQLRTWRPSIVILDQPAKDDVAGQLLLDASLRAIDQATDATRFSEQRELTGLSTWRVERIYLQLAGGTGSDATIDLDEYLPRRKMSVRLAASVGDALVRPPRSEVETVAAPRHLAYRWIGVDGRPSPNASLGRDFFAGLSLAPGADARRELAAIDESNLELMQKLVQKHRNFQAISARTMDDPRMAGQMIGQLGGLVRDMDSRQGAELLRGLADEYRERSLFDLVEATNMELVRRYPNEPAALDAMRWLFQFWISSETAWQRMRRMTNETAQIAGDVRANAKLIQQAADTLTNGYGGVKSANYDEARPAMTQTIRPGQLNRVNLPSDADADPRGPRNGTRPATVQQDWRTGEMREWHKRAADLAAQLDAQSPGLFHTPEIQFPLAALRRSTGSLAKSDAIFRNYVSRATEPSIKHLAEREIWLMLASSEPPRELATCQRTMDRPRLDGVLSDPCWLESRDLRLTTEDLGDDQPKSDPTATLVMLSYDSEFLYVGLSVPRREGANLDRPVPGRGYDADLSRHDRVTICLDVDRDYSTWYEFHVDQRGWTCERCWEDRRWNPVWYVASDADETHWRIEAAIPWSELVATPPQRGTVWGAAITRTTPTVGMQSWVQPALTRPRPSSFGLLKFD